jgi:hypothetical protein
MSTNHAENDTKNGPKSAPVAENKSTTHPVPETPPIARLTTLRGVRAHLSWVVQSLENRTMHPSLGNALVVALNALSGVIADTDVEQRIAALEKRQAHK